MSVTDKRRAAFHHLFRWGVPGWMHSFTTTGERTNITHVDMQVSAFAVGENMLICVWSDPNGDFRPGLSPVQVDEAMAWEVVRFDVPDVDLEFEGVPFFVGG